MRNYKEETSKRVEFIKNALKEAKADGIIFGNSGGKDCALVGILSKLACDNVLSVMMPCVSKRNYNEDLKDAIEVNEKYNIDYVTVDLTPARELFIESVKNAAGELTALSMANINPRLRMTTLYSIAQTKNMLVAGTGNASERYMGYFTKWGDGACDFNPISDLTVKEVYEFLDYLNAPEAIMTKAPSAALFEGQTDEQEMGITYKEIDNYILNGIISDENRKIVEGAHLRTEHKRQLPKVYKE